MRARRRIATCFVVVCLAGTSLLVSVAPASARVSERPDRTWMVDGKVFALARSGGTLFVGGSFSRMLPPRGSGAAPVAVRNLAALDLGTGAPIRSWSARATGGGAVVRALAVSGDRLYVGGDFRRLAGTAVSSLGAVAVDDGDAVARFTPGVSGKVFALLAGGGRLYAGGAFGRVDGAGRLKLAAFRLPGGALSSDWRPRAVGGAVRDLAFAPGSDEVFVAGAFPEMAQQGQTFTRESLAKVDATDGSLSAWQTVPGDVGRPMTAWSVVVDGNRLHGGFGRGPNFAASFVGTGAVGTRLWRRSLPGNVQATAMSSGGSRLFLGGHFGLAVGDEVICGENVRGLISVDPDTGEPLCGWVPQIEPFDRNFNGPWAMLVAGDSLWVGGGWGKVDGVVQRGLARFDVG